MPFGVFVLGEEMAKNLKKKSSSIICKESTLHIAREVIKKYGRALERLSKK